MSTAAVRCEDVGKQYRLYENPRQRLVESVSRRAASWYGRSHGEVARDVWAIRHVSFEVPPGETVGIIGTNGSGKSTLLQIIAGTVTPTEGSVGASGRVAALLELGAGFSPEFSGLDNARMNASILGLDPDLIEARLEDIVAFADIGRYIDQPVRTYSSGMFLRLAFAVAVHVDPDIVIIDEALAVGDVAFQAKCIARIKRLQDEGKTLLFVSHDLSAVRTLCRRCLYLERGTTREYGAAPTVVDTFIRDVHRDPASTAVPPHTAGPAAAAGPAWGDGDGVPNRMAAFLSSRGAPHGTGDAIIRLVELTDEEGRPVSIVEFDAAVRVHIWIECVRACTVSVNYKIRNRQLVSVAGADFLIAGCPLEQMEPGRRYHVEYTTQVALQDGDYTLRTSVTTPIDRHDQAVFIDVVEVAAPFTVLPAARGRIYTQAYLPNTVCVERELVEDPSCES